ncbi:MAG: hypothetical protein V1897_12350 [Pseudomonadota bacterium]
MTVNEKILFDALKQSLDLINNMIGSDDVSDFVIKNRDFIEMILSDGKDALSTVDDSMTAICKGDSCRFSLS